MSKTSSCAQTMSYGQSDATRLFIADMARDGAAAWRDLVYLVDSALLPIVWIINALRAWDPKARRMAMWSNMSDRDLRDVGLARGGALFLTRNPNQADRLATRFE